MKYCLLVCGILCLLQKSMCYEYLTLQLFLFVFLGNSYLITVYALRYWYLACLASVFMIFEVLVDLYQPRLMASIIDHGILGIGHDGKPDPDFILSTGLVMLLVTVAGCLCGIGSGIFANMFSQKSANSLRKSCFGRILDFSFAQTDNFTTGSLITRNTSDITQIRIMWGQMIRGAVRCAMFLFAGSIALLSLTADFGAVVLVAMPVIIAEIVFFLWKTTPLFTALQEKLDRINAVIRENVLGIRVVKAYVRQDREIAGFDASAQDLADVRFKIALLMAALHPVMNIVLNLSIAAVIYSGAVRVESGDLAPGSVMAGVTYMSQILMSLLMAAMIFQTVSRGSASARRVGEVLRQKTELSDGTLAKGTVPGSVAFRHVSFAYPGSHGFALHDVSFEIHPGGTLAVIGPTGSGKSTLAALIARFYDVECGAVMVDDQDVRLFSKRALRRRVSVVLQSSQLLSGTVADNITGGIEDASLEEIQMAASMAEADEFICSIPKGYDTPVGAGGFGLSGGQRQRLALSRALFRKSDILILDDATSALDFCTERRILDHLRESFSSVTKIIIAQRISTVMSADHILVLDQGRVVGQGTHSELMVSSPLYQSIWQSQMKEEQK